MSPLTTSFESLPCRWLSFLAIMALVSACVEPPPTIVDGPREQHQYNNWIKGGDSRTTPTGDSDRSSADAPPVTGPEVCDGWDNDGDGAIDEETGGQPCTQPDGTTGTSRCVQGALECQSCTPGSTRQESCGCGTVRVDICSSDATWRLGSCDGCETPVEPCGECMPGEEMYQRCDTCSDTSCGTTCTGASWRCSAGCAWEQISACEALNSQCNRDQIINEPCGLCGSRRLECDGCFWVADACVGEGVCAPGDSKSAPCFEEACSDGMASTVSCNDQCDWDPPTDCVGCTIGSVEEQIEQCVPGYQCGEVVTQTVCNAQQSLSICDGTDELWIGELITTTSGECSITCAPAETRESSCTLADGRAGTETSTCTATCDWGPGGGCGATSGSCIPGTIETEQRTCGSGACAGFYDRIRTCRNDGSGWSTSSANSTCPDCSTGQTRQVSCTTALGECGTQTAACESSCIWGPPQGECVPRAHACVPGTVETEQRSCGSGTCGITYAVTRTCRSGGCGWNEDEDRSGCPTCSPGDVEEESCTTSDNRCGIRQRTCSTNSCSWSSWGACQPLPDACSEGSVENRSCAGMCGATGTERWECMGCSWIKVAECDATPPCVPGEEEVLGQCVSGIPECGDRTRTCDASCQWVETGCPPCG